MTACVIIPARHASTRFPGKPLTPLLGKPMILWVAELSARAVGPEHVYVATEDTRISTVVEEAGFRALMTSKTALTGTDRLAEAAEMIDYDIYVNVQGDEPLVNPEDIKRCAELKSAALLRPRTGFCSTAERSFVMASPQVALRATRAVICAAPCARFKRRTSLRSPSRTQWRCCCERFMPMRAA